MLSRGRLRSLPLVNGTMQYVHMLLQPRMMLMKADTASDVLFTSLTGAMSAYVSSCDSCNPPARTTEVGSFVKISQVLSES